MIIHCPECSSRFLIDTELLKKEPKKLRCGQCGNAWMQDAVGAEGQDAALLDDRELKEPYFEKSSLPNNVVAGEPQEDTETSGKKSTKSAQKETAPLAQLSKDDLSARRRRARGKAVREEKGSSGFQWLLLFIVLLSLTGSVLFRGEIVNKIENLTHKQKVAKVFSQVGFPVVLKRDALVFRETKAVPQKSENGQKEVLVATGTVKNVSLIIGAVPALDIVAVNKFGKHLETWRPVVARKALSPSMLTDYSVEIGKLPARTRFLKTVIVEKNTIQTVRKEIERLVPEKYHGALDKVLPIYKSVAKPTAKKTVPSEAEKTSSKKGAGAKFLSEKYGALKSKIASFRGKKDTTKPKAGLLTGGDTNLPASIKKPLQKTGNTFNKAVASDNKITTKTPPKKNKYIALLGEKYGQAKSKLTALKGKYLKKGSDRPKTVESAKSAPVASSQKAPEKKVWKAAPLKDAEKKKNGQSNVDKTFRFFKEKFATTKKAVLGKKEELLNKYVGPKPTETVPVKK
ncbi:MAG: zinc-ribbon domain-containing protein [Alphaproteobacteria bacterium]